MSIHKAILNACAAEFFEAAKSLSFVAENGIGEHSEQAENAINQVLRAATTARQLLIVQEMMDR